MDSNFSQFADHETPLAAAVLSSLRTAVIATDLEGKIVYWNAFAEGLYGWPAKEVIGHNVAELQEISGNERPLAEIISAVKAGQTLAEHFALRKKDGASLSALATHSPLAETNGRLMGIVTAIHDSGDHKGSAQERSEIRYPLLESRQELEKIVQERTMELNAATDSLRELSGRLLRMQDDERRRIARELHDSVGQLLAAVSINLASVESEVEKLSPAAARAVSENLALVAEINKEIRTISHLLHPPLLDEAGLVSALSWYVRGFSERSRIRVTMEISPDFPRPTKEMEIAIFRIVQESLTNIHRHSGSAEASVRVVQNNGRVLVEIKDSGKGIPQKSSPNLPGRAGVGIRGMRERIRQLGGVLDIRSDDRGTTVEAILPMMDLSAPSSGNKATL